jgi:hypothetical protein
LRSASRGLVGGGQRGRDDSAGETLVSEGRPEGGRDKLSVGGSTGAVGGDVRVDKVEGPVEKVGGVLEWDVVGPGDVLGRERDGVGFELDAFEVFDDAVGGSAVAVPEWPPAAVLFGKGGVG